VEAQATPYTPQLKESYAWWTREFLDGLISEIDLPRDWTTIRTILILAQASPGDRPATGDAFYFELPAGIAIDSLKTEAHLFLFKNLPPDPQQALQQLSNADARYTCQVLGAENRQGNRELNAQWQIEAAAAPVLRRVPSGILRPVTQFGMQQVRAEVKDPSVKRYEYLFERERVDWVPVFSERETLRPQGPFEKDFPVPDNRWARESDRPWKLVIGLKHGEGAAFEKDAAALALAKPESGSFILVSLRRRPKNQTQRK
jgi:hypothetical protein